jgi:hypothetical protein
VLPANASCFSFKAFKEKKIGAVSKTAEITAPNHASPSKPSKKKRRKIGAVSKTAEITERGLRLRLATFGACRGVSCSESKACLVYLFSLNCPHRVWELLGFIDIL